MKERESKLKCEYKGEKEDLMIVGISDTSLKTGEKAVGGVFFFLNNSSMMRASPIYLKSNQIDLVCHSSKDAETLILLKMIEDLVYTAHQLEQLLYGDVMARI